MPFGLTNAPSTFQPFKNDVFKPFLRKFILVFFDDIPVYSQNWDGHLWHLRLVLETMKNNTLIAKRSNFVFRPTYIKYLRHFISVERVVTSSYRPEQD